MENDIRRVKTAEEMIGDIYENLHKYKTGKISSEALKHELAAHNTVCKVLATSVISEAASYRKNPQRAIAQFTSNDFVDVEQIKESTTAPLLDKKFENNF